LAREELSELPASVAPVWTPVVRALTDEGFKKAVFGKLAPDLAERFNMPERGCIKH
jgi:hypothetical protein